MKKEIAAAAVIACACNLNADTPIQLSLTPAVALYPSDTMVRGISLEIWGENPREGLAFGFINGSTGDSGGLSWGLVNYDESFAGVQWGVVNYSREKFLGWQDGWVNISQGSFKGFQSGVVNISEDTKGFQLGFINYAEKLNGLQIGAVNVAMNNPVFSELPDKFSPVFPILNWSF